MKARYLVAGIGAPILVAALTLLPPFVTGLLLLAVNMIGTVEIFRISGLEKRVAALLLTALTAAGVQLFVWFGARSEAVILLLPFGILLFLCGILYYETGRDFGAPGFAAAFFSGFLVPLGLSSMTALRQGPGGSVLVLTPLVVSFLGDTGAFFAGRALGKRKMAPRTSPHKTVAGLIGGLISSAVAMVLFGLVCRLFGLHGALWKLALIGFVAGAASQLGDLSFSLIKRYLGVKDYGNLLPGHGGAYDRFDSTTFSAPVVLLLLNVLEVF